MYTNVSCSSFRNCFKPSKVKTCNYLDLRLFLKYQRINTFDWLW